MEVVKNFSDISMEFGLDKCAFVLLKKGGRADEENIINDAVIKELEPKTTYRYLGIEESERIENRIKKKYMDILKAIQKTTKTQKQIEAMKVLAIPVITDSELLIGFNMRLMNWM